MNRDKLIFWISTGLMCAIFLFSAALYVFGHEFAVNAYNVIGFPTWILYPSAFIKVLGVIAVLTRKSKLLLEWAYSGFFFDVVFATIAHLMAGDGSEPLSIFAIVVSVVSRIYYGKMYGKIVYTKEA
ncbi:MAG: DoxX family protein [Marinifilaceae bacterium]